MKLRTVLSIMIWLLALGIVAFAVGAVSIPMQAGVWP